MKNLTALVAQFPVAEFKSPTNKVQEGETVLGVLPDDLKRLWGFLQSLREKHKPELKRLSDEHMKLNAAFLADHMTGSLDKSGKHNHAACEARQREIMDLATQYKGLTDEIDAIARIFWDSVRVEFNAFDADQIGLREKGQVVAMKSKKYETIEFEGNFADLGELLETISRGFRTPPRRGRRTGFFSQIFGNGH